MSRTLHLACYDVCDHRRLARTTRYLASYRVAGQKSVPELWITPAELATIQADLAALLDPQADKLQIVALDPRMQPHCMGVASTFDRGDFYVL